ncbi:hypothetical protein WUBG_16591 [Wuchereria bancrofti]|uniref:Uncharacterized protein n=1 Tax=Wuchereria bancrofti TaxID=6293 RepID=J9DSC1_WUCBA|nr:hypothetical protein WUBG_16591 [Wuchereria bancrofti]
MVKRQHECVSIINNYVALDEIEKLLHPRGDDSDEIYSKEFSRALHNLIKTHIIHPVWVMLFLRDHYQLIWQHRQKFCYVLDRIFERQLRCKESNEHSLDSVLNLVVSGKLVPFSTIV